MTTAYHRLLLASLLAAGSAGATHAATFTFTGTHLNGSVSSIPVRANSGNTVGTISGVAFDPTSLSAGQYTRIYFTNREPTTGTAKGGYYSLDVPTGTVTFLGLPSNAADNNRNSSSIAVNNSGSVYVGQDVAPRIYRIDNPLGVPNQVQILGNYAGSTDDDPISISVVPSTNQLLVFDQGLDNDLQVAVSIVEPSSTSGTPVFTTIWSDTQTVEANLRGTFSSFDNNAYFTYLDTPIVSGMGAIYRLSLGGSLDTILLNGISASWNIDDSIAINPADGSAWLPVNTGGTDRTYYRVDLANMTLQSPGVYLANVTQEFTALAFNAGLNSVTFSPDGKVLAVGTPDGADMIYLFQTSVPEPASVALVGIAALAGLVCRRSGYSGLADN
jgi:WD40 repeat protein